MKYIQAILLVLASTLSAHAGALLPGGVQLLCHRTANEDVPENTLESLDQAALLGCNVVEIDLRRTLDGKIVLNHDGILERLTDGVGEVDQTYYGDLKLRDAGSWMADRFTGLRMTLFEDALRLARERDIRLILDIKDKSIGFDVLQIVQREGMLQRVQFGGESDDLKKSYPHLAEAGADTVWVQPGVTAEQVREYHAQGKSVVANFSANSHQMDLAGMKAAVAAGVDGINVDYPRLGADAVGRPVERRLRQLILKADSADSNARISAILELSRYSGFPLQQCFTRWLLDPDDHVSRAAALALVTARPATSASAFAAALQSQNADARANAAWALGMLDASADTFLPLLQDKNPDVLQAALLALARAPGNVSADVLLPLISNSSPDVRGAAARALSIHQPEIAIKEVPAQLLREKAAEHLLYLEHNSHAHPESFTPAEIAAVTQSFKCQMEMMRAIYTLKGSDATGALAALAFQPDKEFSQFDGIIAGFQLWDRIGTDPAPAIQTLGSNDDQVADRAEWMLVKAGPSVLPEVRRALDSQNVAIRERAIRIAAWQGDQESLDKLHTLTTANGADATLAAWAVQKIGELNPQQ